MIKLDDKMINDILERIKEDRLLYKKMYVPNYLKARRRVEKIKRLL